MHWTTVVGFVVLAYLAITLVLPTTRRVWVFHLLCGKYLFLWTIDRLGLRFVWAKIVGKPYERLIAPVLLRHLAEDLGPTFIKFGQIVASSSGMFPKRYVQEFQRCLDRVRPFPFAKVQQILAEELGPDAAKLTQLDPQPLASASIAQVHSAKLEDGADVVVKVQRPGIQGRVEADMKVLKFLAGIAERFIRDAELVNPVGIVEDFHATIREELDFRLEAQNLSQFNHLMHAMGHDDVRAPKPYKELTTPRLLTMERFFGTRVDDVEKMTHRNVDAEAKLILGMQSWFRCVLFHGFFHGDVHAGNLMILDNDDIGFLDFGIVGRFNERQRRLVTDYVVAFASADYTTLARVIVEMGSVHEEIDVDAFAKDLEAAYSPMLKLSFSEMNYAEIIPRIQQVSSKHRMKMPKEFVLITKQMLYFDRYAKLLAPKLNVFTDSRIVMSMMADIMKARAESHAVA
jgi:predicted unusual protein kinase regulating ubiquinone biosynthesis (AarF/ABC1/UbiB family)